MRAYNPNTGQEIELINNQWVPVEKPQYTGLTEKIFGQNPPEIVKRLGSFTGGGNQLLAAMAGMPVDVATNLTNLGIAGYGTAKSLLTGSTDLPEPIGPQFLGSQSIKEGAESLIPGMMSPSSQGDIDKALHTAGGVISSGAMAPGSMLANMARMTPSAAGAVAGQQMFPDQPLAPALGSLLGGTTMGLIESIPATQISSAAKKFVKMGYKVLPVSAKKNLTQDVMQGSAGTVPLKQVMSTKNQQVSNAIARKEFGLPDDAPLDIETMGQIRETAGQVYNQARAIGKIKPDATFINKMRSLARPSSLGRSFPGAVKKDLIAEVQKYNVRSMDAEGIIDATKQLRRDYNTGIISMDPQIKDMARVQKKIADVLEGLLERRVQKIQPSFYPEFKAARQTIAKSYTLEKALVDGNVDAVKLAKNLNKGTPLSGGLKDIAEFGRNFKEVAQVKPPQTTEFRPMDLVVGGAAGLVDPKLMALAAARPALRRILMSKKYQNSLIKESDFKSIMSLPKQAQAGALVYLLENKNP